jgi:hypothetical protein
MTERVVNGFYMRSDSIVRVKNHVLAAWKWSLSFLKRYWGLSDYPLALRKHEIDPDYAGSRLKQHRYSVAIVNWWVMSGGGDTKLEAQEELEKRFAAERVERAKIGKPFPRPGTHVPIEFASRQRVDAHPELAEDFIRRVLNLDWAWLSDESFLWDFHSSDDNTKLIAKIKEVYGVDVSDIASARLSEILERIASQQRYH